MTEATYSISKFQFGCISYRCFDGIQFTEVSENEFQKHLGKKRCENEFLKRPVRKRWQRIGKSKHQKLGSVKEDSNINPYGKFLFQFEKLSSDKGTQCHLDHLQSLTINSIGKASCQQTVKATKHAEHERHRSDGYSSARHDGSANDGDLSTERTGKCLRYGQPPYHRQTVNFPIGQLASFQQSTSVSPSEMKTGTSVKECHKHKIRKRSLSLLRLRSVKRINAGKKSNGDEQNYSKKFASTSGLKQKLRVHVGKKKYYCKTWNTYVADHGRFERENTPHKCNTCNKRFERWTLLRVHERVHKQSRKNL